MMMAKVLVLGDSTKLSQSVRSCLLAEGLAVVSDSSEPIDLVVYLESEGKEGWLKLQNLMAQHPWLPQIYLIKKTHFSFNWIPHSELSLWLHPTQGQAELTHWVKRFIALGQMAKQSIHHRPLIDSLSLEEVLDRLLLSFGQKIKCSNVHWVSLELWESLKKSGDEELKIMAHASQRRSCSWRAAVDQDIARNFAFLRRMSHLVSFSQGLSSQEQWFGNHLVLFPRKREGGDPMGYFVFEEVGEFYDQQILSRQVLQSMGLYQPYLEFALQHWRALSQTYLDDLTELHNQRYLPMVLEQEVSRARRQGQNFSVLFMDVDFFKTVNDTKGHWVGSQLLVEIGRLLKACLRTCDYAFRYGGDEFIVVLVNTGAPEAEGVAERIRETIEKTHFLIEGNKVQVTMSIGLASYPQHAQSKEQLIKMADEAMYYGKNKSRNIVYVAS